MDLDQFRIVVHKLFDRRVGLFEVIFVERVNNLNRVQAIDGSDCFLDEVWTGLEAFGHWVEGD